MELAKKKEMPHFKATLMVAVALTISTIWTLAFTQSAHARGAVAVAARAAPAVSVARSAPTVTRSTPVRTNYVPAATLAVAPKAKKNCNLEHNKKLKECISKEKR